MLADGQTGSQELELEEQYLPDSNKKRLEQGSKWGKSKKNRLAWTS